MEMILAKATSDPDTARWHFKNKDKKFAAFYPHLFGIYRSDLTEERKEIIRDYTSKLLSFYNEECLAPHLRTLSL